jgi:drug/metabolite transporter (DMT)-like permease
MNQVATLFNFFKHHAKNNKGGALAYIALFIVCIGWGTTWLASKNAIQKPMDVWQIAGIRQFLGGLIYVVFFLLKGHRLPKGNEWIDIAILSFLNFLCSNGLSTYSMRYLDSGIGAVLGALYPIWLLIITSLFYSNQKLKNLGIAGIFIGFAGILIVFFPKITTAQSSLVWLGIILCTISTITWAFASIYTKKKAKSFNAYFSIGWQMLLSATIMTGYSWLSGSAVSYTEIPAFVWYNIFYLVIAGSIISYGCFLYCLQRMSPSQVSIYAYVNPIVAIFVGWWLGGEHPSIYVFVGSIIALLGVFIVQYSTQKKI